MSQFKSPTLSRRTFMATASAAGLTLPFIYSAAALAASPVREFRLRAGLSQARIAREPYAETQIWGYNSSVPGPEIRIKQGEKLRVIVDNALAEDTTVHWHGMRVPNAMDGVPHLTQSPIAVGESFTYEFEALDAGTYWYHPHQRSYEQVGRGLYGPLIVEEENPIRVDRDITWILDDWRLTKKAEISDDFGGRHDEIHAGRIGNTITINGQVPESFAVQKGERIRLRLINAANARIFGLDVSKLDATIIALDGQPVTPHKPEGGKLIIGPAMRIDLVIDMQADPGSKVAIIDRFYEGLDYQLIDFSYTDTPLRENTPDWPIALASNLIPEPDLAAATRHDVVFNGGMMGQMMMQGQNTGMMGSMMSDSVMGNMMNSMMNMMHDGKIWFINGKAASGRMMDPLITLAQNQSHIIAMTNNTAWHHPIHLHGHSFRVIKRNGQPTQYQEWQDTVLMAPEERVEIAFVADNPGDWMFHCHILEHAASGMMGVIRVAEGA